jgi:hypothetical protein
MRNECTYAELSNFVNAGLLQTPLNPAFPADADDSELWCELDKLGEHGGFDPWDRYVLVVDNRAPVGWLDPSEAEGRLRHCAEPIELSRLVSASTPFPDIVALLAAESETPLFVLDGSRISGTLTPRELSKLPARLCLLALVSDLEIYALRICLRKPQDCWNALPEGRQKKAEDVHSTRYPSTAEPPRPSFRLRALLSCTCLADKPTMIGKCKLLPGVSRTLLDSVFGRAEDLRNACAHPADIEALHARIRKRADKDRPTDPFGIGALREFLEDAERLLQAMKSALPDSYGPGDTTMPGERLGGGGLT